MEQTRDNNANNPSVEESQDFGLGVEEQVEQQDTSLAEQLEDTSNVDQQVESNVEQSEERAVNKSNKELNFQKLRDEKAKAERERDELLSYLRKNQPQDQRQEQVQRALEEEEEEDVLGEDDLVEGRHYKKVNNKLKKVNEQLIEMRVRSQYPDFEKVATQGNLKTLKELHPELASTIGSSKDLYNQAVSAYTLIKKLGIYVDDAYEKQREVVQQNAAKPKSTSTVAPQQGDSPLQRANMFAQGLTPQLKAQLYAEMQAVRKNYN